MEHFQFTIALSFSIIITELNQEVGGWKMNIHEYQGKEIFRSMGVAVPEGRVAFTAEEAVEKAKELDTEIYVVKAQIHAGGRGKSRWS